MVLLKISVHRWSLIKTLYSKTTCFVYIVSFFFLPPASEVCVTWVFKKKRPDSPRKSAREGQWSSHRWQRPGQRSPSRPSTVLGFFFKFLSFICRFLSSLGLCCCTLASSSCGDTVLSFWSWVPSSTEDSASDNYRLPRGSGTPFSHVANQAHVLSRFSCVRLRATPWTVAHEAPLSIGFSRQEYWSGWPCPPPGDRPDPGIEPWSPAAPALQAGALLLSPQRCPCVTVSG